MHLGTESDAHPIVKQTRSFRLTNESARRKIECPQTWLSPWLEHQRTGFDSTAPVGRQDRRPAVFRDDRRPL